LFSYFQVEAPIHRPSFFQFCSLTIKDKTKISLTIQILLLGQGSFTRKVRTIFTLKIIVSIFVNLFLILVLHLRQFFIVRIFVKRATGKLAFMYITCVLVVSIWSLFLWFSELILEMCQQYGIIVLILLVQYNIMYMYWHVSVIFFVLNRIGVVMFSFLDSSAIDHGLRAPSE
jgi:hypothetical protein